MTNPERFGTGFVLLFTGGRIRNKNVPVWSPEILNPEFKVGTLYPNTSESGKFCSVSDSFNKSGYFPPAFLYFFGNIITLVKILSRLKRLTSCGYLHLVVDNSLQNPCSYSRLLITSGDHFRCLLRRRRTHAGS